MALNLWDPDQESHFVSWLDQQSADLLYHYGWTDGGCLLLASAIHSWSNGNLAVRVLGFDVDGDLIAGHYCNQIEDENGHLFLLDGDGMWRPDDLIDNLNHDCGHYRLIEPEIGQSIWEQAQRGDRPCEEPIIPGMEHVLAELRKRLFKKFGDYAPMHRLNSITAPKPSNV